MNHVHVFFCASSTSCLSTHRYLIFPGSITFDRIPSNLDALLLWIVSLLPYSLNGIEKTAYINLHLEIYSLIPDFPCLNSDNLFCTVRNTSHLSTIAGSHFGALQYWSWTNFYYPSDCTNHPPLPYCLKTANYPDRKNTTNWFNTSNPYPVIRKNSSKTPQPHSFCFRLTTTIWILFLPESSNTAN